MAPTSAVGKALVGRGQFSAFAGSPGLAQSLASLICGSAVSSSLFPRSSSKTAESAMISEPARCQGLRRVVECFAFSENSITQNSQ